MNAESKAEIERIMAKGDRSLKVAKRLKKTGDYDFAVSRAYYAMFHYATAALLTKGLSFSKHRGVSAGFSQHFVKPGIFPKEFSKSLRNAFRRRNISDYEYGYVTEEVAVQTIGDAEGFIEGVKIYLKKAMREKII